MVHMHGSIVMEIACVKVFELSSGGEGGRSYGKGSMRPG
jgi:hypothetical protein